MSNIGLIEDEYGVTLERWGREVTITPEGNVQAFLHGPHRSLETYLRADGSAWIDLVDGGAVKVHADGRVERLTPEDVTGDAPLPTDLTSSVQDHASEGRQAQASPPAARPDLDPQHRRDEGKTEDAE